MTSSTYTTLHPVPAEDGIPEPMDAGAAVAGNNTKTNKTMTKKKSLKQGPPCPAYEHSLPKTLADLLHQKQGERYTKYEAFRYLCERQALQAASDPSGCPTPFTVTITDLSLDWGWHRHTVTDFLEKLSGLGMLTVEKTTTSFHLFLTGLSVQVA